jgi:uncharacterized protein (TIGR00251 family)
MRVEVFCKLKSRQGTQVVKNPESAETTRESLVVHLKSSPVEGAANRELVQAVAKFYGVPKSAVEIVKGHTCRTKLLEVDL